MNFDVAPAEKLAKVQRYLENRLEIARARLSVESCSLPALAGRVLATEVCSAIDLPNFRRAMMDGVAIEFQHWSAGCRRWLLAEKWTDSQSAPVPTAFVVATGGRVQDTLDTVVPQESLVTGVDEKIPNSAAVEIANGEILRFGQHVAQVGEDVRSGQRILPRGRVVRGQDLGLLSACGITQAEVFRRPRIAVALTGDEVAQPGSLLRGDQVHDANGPVLAALLQRDGADVCPMEYLADDPIAIQQFLQRDDADLLLLCGGTSVGPKDFVAATLGTVGSLAFHGLPIRPGRPVGIGDTATATVFLLPGNPIACQFTYELLVGPLVRGLAGRASDWPYRRSIVRLTESVASQCGRLDYLRVVRVETPPTRKEAGDRDGANQPGNIGCEPNVYLVRPLTSGRASNLTSVSEADGFVLVPLECERLSPSDEVVCYWFDERDFSI